MAVVQATLLFLLLTTTVSGAFWSRATVTEPTYSCTSPPSGGGGGGGGGAWDQIPEDPVEAETWFDNLITNVPYEARKAGLDSALAAAEDSARVVRVSKDGDSDFRTIAEAVKSIPRGNTGRVIVSIGAGEYREKIRIDRSQPFVTFYGSDPEDRPVIVFGGTARKFGTYDSATVISEADYFTAVNIVFANSAPKPKPGGEGSQAVAIRVSGDKSAFYNCVFLGFQDTLCDDKGNHFFKNSFIQGTYDYIFGAGTSLYLSNELRTIGYEKEYTVITAQKREKDDSTGFVFAHCKCTGEGHETYLGRSWRSRPRVWFAYTYMDTLIHPQGWLVDHGRQRSVEFYEYKNRGVGANPGGRAKFVKQLGDAEAAHYLTLDFIEGMTWLLPPPRLKQDGSIYQP